LDACALIYRFEGNAALRDATTGLIAELTANQPKVALAVSRLSVLECRVKPLREGDSALLQRYAAFFAAVQVIELDAHVVEIATDLRARQGLKTPDALQAACALRWQSMGEKVVFLTADNGFAKVPELGLRLIYPAPLPSAKIPP